MQEAKGKYFSTVQGINFQGPDFFLVLPIYLVTMEIYRLSLVKQFILYVQFVQQTAIILRFKISKNNGIKIQLEKGKNLYCKCIDLWTFSAKLQMFQLCYKIWSCSLPEDVLECIIPDWSRISTFLGISCRKLLSRVWRHLGYTVCIRHLWLTKLINYFCTERMSGY